jgi:hypothetical protein
MDWDGAGKVVRKDAVTDGPYAEIKESLGGLIVVRAKDYDEAVEIAKGCPIQYSKVEGPGVVMPCV